VDSHIKGSKGRFRVVLLLRPDIFNSIGMQNLTNKVRDNSVYLDWRTTYPNYRNSNIFQLVDRLLSAQQDGFLKFGDAWDYYFPWQSITTHPSGEFNPSFYKFLKNSYSRPRDIVTMLQILQEEFKEKKYSSDQVFKEKLIDSYEFKNKYSEYLMGGIKDQLSFYYNKNDYDMFLKFFTFLDGKFEFSYKEYKKTYEVFIEHLLQYHDDIPEFVETDDIFLQFLYDTNIICYIEELELEKYFRWCYRERSPSNISPKVKINARYMIHYGLHKALNVGSQRAKKY
jgi:hypothetical protein